MCKSADKNRMDLICPPRQLTPANRDLNTSMEGDMMTTEGRLFHIQMVAGKKLCLKTSTDPTGMQNLLLCPLMFCVFGVR